MTSFGQQDYYQVFTFSTKKSTAAGSETKADDIVPWMAYDADSIAEIDRVASADYHAFIDTYDWSALEGKLDIGNEGLAVLDVGCGSGYVPKHLHTNPSASRFANMISSYDLLDISANGIRSAADGSSYAVEQKYHTKFQDFLPSSQPRNDKVYDLVWSTHGVTPAPRQDCGSPIAT